MRGIGFCFRIVVTVVLFLFWSGQMLYAQRVSVDVDAIREYSVGLELFQKKKYAAAQERFALALTHRRPLPSIERENAQYYRALCGLELFNPDGEPMMETFIHEHPEHPKVNMAHFHLARWQYSKKRYSAVLKELSSVDPEKLDQDDLEEYYFKKGYSHFEQEEYDQAKEALSHVVGGGKKYRSPALYYHSYILYREQKNEAALAGFKELECDATFGKVVPFYILQIQYRQGRNEEVVAYGTELLKKDFAEKRSGEIHRILGEAYFNLGRYAEAVPEMEYAISELGGNRDDRYKLAYAAYRGGDHEKALKFFEQVTGEGDDIAQLAFYHMGDCFLKTGRKMEARGAFRSAAKYSFDEKLKEDALFNFAKLAYELSYDPYHEAIQAFEEYIDKNPQSERVDEAYGFLLKVYLTTKNYEAALNAIDKMKQRDEELKTTYQRISYLRGAELFNDLQFADAIQFFKRSEKYPLDTRLAARSLFWQAEAYGRLNDRKAAESYYALFIESPGAIGLTEFQLAHYGMGYLNFDVQQYDAAILWFRKFVDMREADPVKVNDGLLRIADAYYLQKKTKPAIEFYDRAIKLNKFDTDYAIFQIAVCYGLEGQNASKVETLKSMLENYPETDFGADAKYEIAQTYFFTDKYQDALAWFDKVITEHPNSSYVRKAMLNKGLLYYNQSSDETALPLFEEVAENYPATEEASEALLKIKKIYVERGDVPAFEKYLASKNFPDVTTGALDTSYYESAELMYLRGQLASALVEFDKYREKFPNGYFKLNANFYAAEAALQLEQYDAAIKSYDKVLEFPKNTFTEKSLIAAGNIYFYQKRYNEALLRYAMLEEVAEVAENFLEARLGLMRCNYLMNNFDEAHEYSLKLRRLQTAPKEVLDEAALTSAKCAMAQNNLKMAEARFKETLLQANNEFGAEAMYSLARIHYLRDSIDRAQGLIFEMVNIFPNYGEWISRSFLLLADTYVKQNDLFQAKLTLQNLIDNYDGELKQDAERKMVEIENMETPLQDRMDGAGFEVEFEQEGKVADDLFEIDEEPQEEILIEERP